MAELAGLRDRVRLRQQIAGLRAFHFSLRQRPVFSVVPWYSGERRYGRARSVDTSEAQLRTAAKSVGRWR